MPHVVERTNGARGHEELRFSGDSSCEVAYLVANRYLLLYSMQELQGS
jgi:hypothetical protein